MTALSCTDAPPEKEEKAKCRKVEEIRKRANNGVGDDGKTSGEPASSALLSPVSCFSPGERQRGLCRGEGFDSIIFA